MDKHIQSYIYLISINNYVPYYYVHLSAPVE